ncbi:MAG: PAS domain S-box protein, partial [bacterium]
MKKLKILHAEDSPSDAELIQAKLEEGGYVCDIIVVEKKEDFIKHLVEGDFDLIFFDFNMPSFNGSDALKIVKQFSPESSVICISGTVGEEKAVELLRSGATDYVLKSNLGRLVPVVKRALKEKEMDDLRKHAEESLAASEVRYHRLFESAKDGILILDAETGMIIDVNPFLIEMLGYSFEQFVGKAVWELGFLKDIVANRDNFFELQQKGYVRYEDFPLETADGRHSDVEFVSNVYLVNNKKVIQCNIRDITVRKRAEEALRESEERYRNIFENAAVGIFRTSLDGHFLLANPTLVKMLGYDTFDELAQLNLEKDGFETGYQRNEFRELIERDGKIIG